MNKVLPVNFILTELTEYRNQCKRRKDINTKLTRKIRRENFPCHISENIVAYTIHRKYGYMPEWNGCKNGDLKYNNKQIEVKAFSSVGPTSFGPRENFDSLYIIDCSEFMKGVYGKYTVYEVLLSNKSKEWRNIKFTSAETFGQIADAGKRPRASFMDIIYPQMKEHCSVIFEGWFANLAVQKES